MRLVLALLLALVLTQPAASNSTARFEGRFLVEPLDDGRLFKLVEEILYFDSDGRQWPVPAGMNTDGASVPRAAWVVFPPFVGKYRIAAVVHDYYCQTRSRPWEDTHRVFYDAMITAGVDQLSAKTMFAAVWLFGPRWLPDGSRLRSAMQALPETKQQAHIKSMQEWIGQNEPSLEQIENALNQAILNSSR